MKRAGTIILTVFILYWILAGLKPAHPDAPFDLRSWGGIPVLDQGRVKPMDSLARSTLLLFRGKQTVPVESGSREKITALNWLWKVVYHVEGADAAPIFRIDDPELVSLLGYAPEEQVYFSYAELQPHLREIDQQAQRVNNEPDKRNRFEKAVVKLHFNLSRYQALATSLRPGDTMGIPLAAELERYYSLTGAPVTEGRDNAALRSFANRYASLARANPMRLIPPAGADTAGDEEVTWLSLWEALVNDIRQPAHKEAALLHARIGDAAASGNAEAFNAALAQLHELDKDRHAGNALRWRFERLLNGYEPFYRSMVLYLIAFLLVCVFWIRERPAWQTAAFWTLAAAFVIHSFGLVSRMYIMQRPPVTNLYSSAVFIGWAAVFLSLVMERMNRNGMAAGVAAAVGFGSLVIAHHLSLSGDTMERMRAVLDSNFWLTTHVITITLGYSAAFLAGFIALLYLLRALLTRGLDAVAAKSSERMVFGVICFTLLFSFIGTVLGGIWADQSWGRFWGWDPKENGALLIVIWNAMILHGYGCKLFRRRGLMVLAVSGNIVTSWSWFGTNMLGIGLHSYGFMEKGFVWLMGFWIFNLLVMALTLAIPRKWWRSQAALDTLPGRP